MRGLAVLVMVVAACGGNNDRGDAGTDAGDGRVVIAEIPVTANRDLDILFAIDDSPGGVDQQTLLKSAFPAFLATLNGAQGGLPNIHLGVVSSDLGTLGASDATPGPGIGSGPGSCSGTGKTGNLQTNGTALVSGNFIADTKNTDGTRSLNYTGPLSDAFGAIVSLGGSGCGFEQPLESVKRALNNNPSNAGFLRPSASLAIVMVSDEDDCSFAHSTLLGADTSTLGPLQSFRCTRFGVTCDVGGATSDAMNAVGAKSGCHSNEASPYLTPVAGYATYLRGLKTDPRMVSFSAIIAPTTPFEVELRTPPGGGTAIPALGQVCTYSGGGANPGVRIEQAASLVERSSFGSVCALDYGPALVDAALLMRRLIGDSCLARPIAMPADCIVADVVGTTATPLPACTASAPPCWELVPDVQNCAAGDHLRFQIQRTEAPAPATVVSIRCRV